MNALHVKVEYTGRFGHTKRFIFLPCKIEYSQKDDKFRCLSKVRNRHAVLNIARIKNCEIDDGLKAGDITEIDLHWFFDHIIEKPLAYESYMIMLACRGKKLTDEEREYTKVGARGEMMREELIRCKGGLKQEWNFDIYRQAFYTYNCDKRSLLTTAGVPYPEHAMVVYSVVNPTNEIDCIEDTFEHYNNERKNLTSAILRGSKPGIQDHLVKMPKVDLEDVYESAVEKLDYDSSRESIDQALIRYFKNNSAKITLPLVGTNFYNWEKDSVPYALGKLCNNIKPEALSADAEKIRQAKHEFYENIRSVT